MPASTQYSDRFRVLIRSLTGISLPASKVAMIDQRLRRRVIAHDLPGTEDYLRLLLDGHGMEDEMREVIDLITTNTTSFFREGAHFRYLADTILPDLLGRQASGRRSRVKLWSAASSEGAEAYTAAMVLADQQRRGHVFDYAILGTDISSRMLEKARMAIYTKEQLSTVPKDMLRQYFLTSSDPDLAGRARVVPELRARVQFRYLNLIEDTYTIDKDVDVIMLRNILIYFDPEGQKSVVERLSRHLAPGGYLIVGHAESMVVTQDNLKQVVPTIFRKMS